jgi:putative tryptophan/tyrosine transport system substrate-binding protein
MLSSLPKLSKKGFSSLVLIIVIASALIAGGYFLYSKSSSKSTMRNSSSGMTPKKIGLVKYIPPLDEVGQGFKQGMKELGYEEGKDIVYVEQPAQGNQNNKLNEIAKSYLDQNVDLIFAFPVESAVAALKESTAAGKLTPIVFGAVDLPIQQGLIKDFKSSGNQTTGVAIDLSQLTAKRLEFLYKIKPSIKKIGVLVEKRPNLAAQGIIQELNANSTKFGYTIVKYDIVTPPGPKSIEELQKYFSTYKSGDFDALIPVPGPALATPEAAKLLVEFGTKNKIPVVGINKFQVTPGMVFSYNYNLFLVGKQAALYADKIFKGATPASLPIEFPQKNDLIVNPKAAERMGVTIPSDILSISDEVL